MDSSTFQKLMDTVFRPIIEKCALVYLDDIIVDLETFVLHIKHLKDVYTLLKQEEKLEKCSGAGRYFGFKLIQADVEIIVWNLQAENNHLKRSLGLEERMFSDLDILWKIH